MIKQHTATNCFVDAKSAFLCTPAGALLQAHPISPIFKLDGGNFCESDLMQHTIVLTLLLCINLSIVQLTVALITSTIDKSMVSYPQLLKRSGLQARQWMRAKALPSTASYHIRTTKPLHDAVQMGRRSFRMGALRMKPIDDYEFETQVDANVPDVFDHREYASEEINLDHILSTSTRNSQIHPYWIEQLKLLDRPAAKSLIPKLLPSNPLGYELASGVAKKGSLMENMIQWKRQHVDKVILTRVGEFYETTGVDALMLVNYAGLNPMGGGVRAGCPIKNIQATLDSLTQVMMNCAVGAMQWFLVKQPPTQSLHRRMLSVSLSLLFTIFSILCIMLPRLD